MRRVLVGFVILIGCAEAPQVSILGAESSPKPGVASTTSAHVHYDTTMDLPSDERLVEPSQPFVATPEERVLAHVHTPNGACSGVVLDSHLVLTAHQCIPTSRGIGPAIGDVHVEIPSGSLTWTSRGVSKVVAPDCNWDKLDLAVLVLSEPADWVKPVAVGTVPGPGANVQAFGFGHCAGESRGIRDKAGSVVNLDSQTLVIAVGLCKGDVGGFVMDGGGSLLGIVSHQDDPDDSPRHTTTIFRADTTPARALVAQAEAVAGGADGSKAKPIPCN